MIKTLHVPIGAFAKAGFKANQQLFLTMVLSFRKTEKGCRMSHSGIAQHLNVSRQTVITMVNGLEKKGWINVTHITNDGESESNLYQPTDKLLNLIGPGQKNAPGPGQKNTAPAGQNILQNTLLSEEKSIQNKVDAFLEASPHLRKVYETQKAEYSIQYANNSVLRLMNQKQKQTV